MAQPNWPTQDGNPEFWEELGRAVGTFGMLEYWLAKTLFIVTAQIRVGEGKKVPTDWEGWGTKVIGGLSDTLNPLATKLQKAWRKQDGHLSDTQTAILAEIRDLVDERNQLCHAAWMAFRTGDEGTLFYFPKAQKVPGGNMQTRSLASISETKERVAAVIKEVIRDSSARS